MKYESLRDPAEFLDRAGPLLGDEARHNLMLGIGRTLVRSPEVYSDYALFLVTAESVPVAAAMMTRPYNLIVADAVNRGALAALVAGLRRDTIVFPGVIGNQPTVDRFVSLWTEATETEFRLMMAQGVFALDREVSAVAAVPGHSRVAELDDLDLIVRWMGEFVAEALPEEPYEENRATAAITRRLSGETPGGYWLWIRDHAVVALSGHGNPTGRGIRIGPVYTPHRHRRNGYATALVTAQSEWLLGHGYEFCFLYTDLANPTSNAIYERIGYRRVADAATYLVVGSTSPTT